MVPATVLTVVGAAARSGIIDALLLGAYALLLVSLTVAFRARRARRSRQADPPRMDERTAARIAAFAPPTTGPVSPPTRARPRAAPETRPSPVAPSPAPATRASPVPETRPSPVATPAATRPSPQQEAAFDTCEIVWWRGFVKSQFFAVSTSGADDIERVAESPLFRWRSAEPPGPVDEPLSAHRTLVAILEADGWTRSGDGGEWYALRFRRPRSLGSG